MIAVRYAQERILTAANLFFHICTMIILHVREFGKVEEQGFQGVTFIKDFLQQKIQMKTE